MSTTMWMNVECIYARTTTASRSDVGRDKVGDRCVVRSSHVVDQNRSGSVPENDATRCVDQVHLLWKD